MFFNKKNKNSRKCDECGSKIEQSYSFCPFCGNSFIDLQKEKEDFGLLGRNDSGLEQEGFQQQGFGMFDKIFSSMVNSMMKNLDKQFKEQMEDEEFSDVGVRAFPNGVRIKISGPFDNRPRKAARKKTAAPRSIGEGQLKKMSSLPRTKARTSVKRIGDRVVYELTTPGLESTDDVFVSKLESGYEIKAIGNKKVYVNSVPINLPLKKYSILKNKLLVEFNAQGG